MKSTLVVGTILVVFAAYFGYHTFYVPQRDAAAKLPEVVAREQATQQVQAAVGAVAQEIESYRRRLPQEADASWLVNQVLSLANEVGVQVSRIVPESPTEINGVTRLGVDLQATASYHELGVFLDRIERAPTFIHVDRLDLSDGGGSAASTSQRSIRLILSTLYLPPSAPADTLTAAPSMASGRLP